MIKKLLLLLFITLLNTSFAQKKSDPLPEHITQAKKLKSQYTDDDIVVLNSTEKVTFYRNKKENKVVVTQKKHEELMNISSRSDIQKYITYNGESSIKKFEIFYRNKKETLFEIQDEAISDDDMFHHDARVKHTHLDFPV